MRFISIDVVRSALWYLNAGHYMRYDEEKEGWEIQLLKDGSSGGTKHSPCSPQGVGLLLRDYSLGGKVVFAVHRSGSAEGSRCHSLGPAPSALFPC